MLPLQFRKMSLDRHIVHRFGLSDANAFRTFDWEIPNCLAMREGVTPALNAARTAFNLPCVKGASETSTCCRFLVSGRTSNRLCKVCKSVSTPRGVLPRRFISSRVAACRKSNSPSLRCLRALGRSFGKICRGGAVSVVVSLAGGAEAVAVGNGSGAVRSVGSPSMRVIMPLTTWGGNQHRAKMVLPLRIELRTSPFITLTLARPPRTAFVRWTIPSPWTLASR